MNFDLIDPELRAMAGNGLVKKLNAETLEQHRATLLEIFALAKSDSQPSTQVRKEERFVPGSQGAPDVRVLIYSPTKPMTERLPAIFHIHGGGFVMGNADMSDLNNRRLVEEFGCVIVDVDYRLAPEACFPGPIEDCYTGLLWLHEWQMSSM